MWVKSSKKRIDYYPFGLKHTNYNTTVLKLRGGAVQQAVSSIYKYKYNNKELQDELGLNVYDYGFRHYMPDIGRWGCIDPLAEKYNSWSGYNYALNNPTLFIDPDGREIDISELMKSKDHAKAFMLFAKTKEGIAFLNNYASKGQKLEYGGKVFYEAKASGKFDKAGIDLNYKVGDSKQGSNTSSDFVFGKDNKLDINIEVAKEGFGSSNKTFNLVEAITHESFLHADSDAKDFSDNGWLDKSDMPKDYRGYGTHADHYYIGREFYADPTNKNVQNFPVNGFNLLMQVSKQLNLNYSNTQIKTQMWNFSGSLIQVDPKSGSLIYRK